MRFLIFLFTFYFLPVTLVKTGVIPNRFNIQIILLVIFSVSMVIYAIFRRFSIKDLGLSFSGIKDSLIWNAVLMIAVSALLLTVLREQLLDHPFIPKWRMFFLFYIIFSCPAQEFIYRSLIFAEMEKSGIKNGLWLVLISASAYCYMHIIFFSRPYMLPITFVMGCVWGFIYLKKRSFYGIALSHSILGTLAVLAGLV